MVESVNDLRYKQYAVTEFLVAKSQWETSTNIFVMFMELLWSTAALLVAGREEWLLPKQEKQSSMIYLT
jgi:hypothetical protein